MAAPRPHLTLEDGDLFWETLADWRNWGFSEPLAFYQKERLQEKFEDTRRRYERPADIAWNNFTMPEAIGFVTSIPAEFYELIYLELISIAVTADANFDAALFPKLYELKIYYGPDVEVMPIYRNEELRSLTVRFSGPAIIPPEINQLRELVVLDLAHNQITALPAEIGDLSNLERLILNYTPIEFLPRELSNLHNLRLLDLSCSALRRIPLEVLKMIDRKMSDSMDRFRLHIRGTPMFEEIAPFVPRPLFYGATPEFVDELIKQRREEIDRAKAFILSNRRLAAEAIEEGEVGMPRPAPERAEDAARRRLASGGAGAGAGEEEADVTRPTPAVPRDVERLITRYAYGLGKRGKAMLELFE